jgi:hypothetical protein
LGVEPAPIYPMVKSEIAIQQIKTMKTKTSILLAILTAIAVASAEAQYTTNILTFSGASWSDGGSLDGYFTIQYDAGTPTAVLSLDVATGNGTSDGFTGFHYIFNVDGQANTIIDAYINATQPNFTANELFTESSSETGSHHVYLDWQGSSPTSLYLGNVGGEYSSENYVGSSGHRTLNDEGGSVGTVPEPTTLALAGLGGLSLLLFRRRK